MSATAIETTLVLHVEQITAGDVTCEYCDTRAVVTVGTGADPDPEPQCVEHAREWLNFTARTIVNLFGKKE